jgi:hypothetical protein
LANKDVAETVPVFGVAKLWFGEINNLIVSPGWSLVAAQQHLKFSWLKRFQRVHRENTVKSIYFETIQSISKQ